MNYNIIYRDKRRSLIDVNRNDKKLKKNILIDVHTITVTYLGQNLKPRYRVIVNQSIGENNETYLIHICHKGPVKLIKRVKIAHSFLQAVSDQFHVTILSLPM